MKPCPKCHGTGIGSEARGEDYVCPWCLGSGTRDEHWNATGQVAGYAEVQEASQRLRCRQVAPTHNVATQEG
jgi:DnaJ-class molecular chaperone